MEYSLINAKVFNLIMEGTPVEDKKNNVTVTNELIFHSERSSELFVKSIVEANLSSGMNMKFNYVFYFQFKGEHSEKEIEEQFEEALLVSITYPYVRSFVSSFSGLAGYESVNLPMVIF
ncbi:MULTISPECIES: hypothetical protein [unclassified Providencia]|uniref:hypothetical protein n=1 Tax=unclassified Providencia TaxID=2633465 RepID=UPI00234A3FDE|nr:MULTISPECIES: hypothetical protein [unclassified Providencia]